MSKYTREAILKHALHLFATEGYEGVSMRALAEQVPVATSVLYHHFKDKDALLKELFDTINTRLGIERARLPQLESASEMLLQRILFQLDHAEEVVAVLKYYVTYRQQFAKNSLGFVPEKAYLHMLEVLDYGRTTGEFIITDREDDAKVMTHAINGFLLEYYPHKLKGKERAHLAEIIHRFLIRSLQPLNATI
jgi:AcrR family transcriptional regulator